MTSSTPFQTITLIGLVLLSCLPGCMAFSDSSAMRIEVEVYKGPLSLEPEIQLGELYGYLVEARQGLINTKEFIDRVGCLKDSKFPDDNCTNNSIKNSEWCKSESSSWQVNCSILLALDDHSKIFVIALEGLACQLTDDQECSLAAQTFSEQIDLNLKAIATSGTVTTNSTGGNEVATEKKRGQLKMALENIGMQQDLLTIARRNDLSKNLSAPTRTNQAKYRAALMAANRTAAAMQAAAFRYATASTAGQSLNYPVRIAMTYFIVATSEYANQIQARADALLKQLGDNGRDRRELPLSTHLRESEPTDFVHLFDWMDAHVPRAIDYFSFNFSPNVEERIKIIERLYADHFWSKINTVYASGRGKTQMAFIKDETGNWNLKSFDNDPTELLEAYTKVAKAALEGVVKVTHGLVTGGSAPAGKALTEQLLAIADQTAPDKPHPVAAPAGTLSLTHLQNRLMTQLDPATFQSDLDQDDKNLQAFNDEDDQEKKKQKKQILSTHRAEVIKKWTSRIDDHSNLVDILSTTVKTK